MQNAAMDLDPSLHGSDGIRGTTENIGTGDSTAPSTLAFETQVRRRSPTPNSSQVLPFATQHETSTDGIHSRGTPRSRSTRSPSTRPKTSGDDFLDELDSDVPVVIPRPKDMNLPYSTSLTGVVYDPRMRFHVNLGTRPDDYHIKPDEEPEDLDHPEKPQRIAEIFQELRDAGLVEDPTRPDLRTDYMMVRIPIRPATEEEIIMIHTPEHVEFVKSLKGMDEDDLKRLNEAGQHEVSMYYHNLSWLCASLSCGGAIEATRAVVSGQVRNAVAVIRPPGHHAEHGEASGFCFFNNVCVAARVMQQDFPETCRKILILDWDVHHGNGVQRAFYDDPNILYISLHVYAGGHFYPNSDFGDHLHCGTGPGLGKSVNVPWSTNGMTDADYIMAFQQVVMPIAVEFDPDLVIISAGFDAAEGDPLGDCRVSPAGYGHMTHMLMQLAKGKVVACLEGGYNLRSIAVSALAMSRVLMGEPPDRLADLTPTPSAVGVVRQVIRTQSKFWKCLYPKDLDIQRKQNLGSERLHDIIREWQSKILWEQYSMTKLFILRTRVSRSFNDQVLATPNYHENRPLLVLFHDPPEAEGYPDPRTSRLELHNTFLTDVSKTYVDWAVKNQFAVIDVNVPRHITAPQDDLETYVSADAEAARAAAAKEVAFYLWDNYIEVNGSSHVFLMGVGDAYSAIIDLLSHHPTASEDVDLTVCFIAEHVLRSVQRSSDDSVAYRYHAQSLVFVSSAHAAFAPERIKKIKRRYGNVVRSPETGLQEMLAAHKRQVTQRMLDLTQDWRAAQAQHTPPPDGSDSETKPKSTGTGTGSGSGSGGTEDTDSGAELAVELDKWRAAKGKGKKSAVAVADGDEMDVDVDVPGVPIIKMSLGTGNKSPGLPPKGVFTVSPAGSARASPARAGTPRGRTPRSPAAR